MHGTFRYVVIIAGSLLAAWGVAYAKYTHCEPVYEAEAKVHVRRNISPVRGPQPVAAQTEGDELNADGEETLSPSVISLASDLLKKRGVIVSLDSPVDSEVDVLIQRTSFHRERQAGQDEIKLCYHTIHQQQAIAVLSAIADAYVNARNQGALPPASPALAILEQQRADVAEGQKRQQQFIAETQRKLATQPFPETQRTAVLEKVKSLSAALAEARRCRLESEHRLLQMKRDIKAGLPISLLTARLPEEQSKSLLAESVETSKRKSELAQHSAKLQELSAVYGRNHPRMVNIQRSIAALHAQVEAATPADQETGAKVDEAQTAGELLVRVLSSELVERQAYEESLQEQIDEERAGLDQHAALQGGVGAANQELARLNSEAESLRQRWEALNTQERPRPATLLEPPKLAALPIWPQFKFFAVAGTGAGVGLSMLFLIAVALWPRPRTPIPLAVAQESDPEIGFESPRTLLERRMERAARLQTLRAATAPTGRGDLQLERSA